MFASENVLVVPEQATVIRPAAVVDVPLPWRRTSE
jgi:hypothetical protein